MNGRSRDHGQSHGAPAPPGLLLTDLYQLNMMQAYEEAGMTEIAVFELFVRRLPETRNFLVAAGLAQVVDFLESAAFDPEEIAWLEDQQRFSPAFLERLQHFRFTGDVDAVAEGEIVFPDEPLLRVIAPLPEAQLLETRIMNLLHFETVIASKAARLRLAAGDKTLVDFGLRRAHGAEAGLLAARASYLAGFDATATVEAGRRFGIPISGTMAHSFVQAHDDEVESFRHFAHSRPDSVILLIDTYDTEAAARKVVALAPELTAEGITLRGVRLDSGDLGAHAVKVRRILDGGGLTAVQIFASGGLDEWTLAELRDKGAPIDGYGIGTGLTTSQDAPALDCAYKLQEYAGKPKRKLSEGKATWPGRKQVYRRSDGEGRPREDLLTLVDDRQEGTPLLQPVMRGGRRIAALPTLENIRAATLARLEKLPPALKGLEPARPYPVTVSAPLKRLAEEATPPAPA
ncbi:nicotinate phosphoribosyltransferase [Pelagibius marinus]|uniref:nicotinate phosphoribosyltransferase n=1 Tax=Pelagibius marinus TaxID=2762760 RepID=UPI0018723D08|nr:nicotinate phosphoribosyltransferase [Pelagibius marinus]